MDYTHSTLYLRNLGMLVGLEEVIFAAVMGYPNENACAEILREGNRYSFLLSHSSPHQTKSQLPCSSTNHTGYLYSRNLKNMFDYDFEQRLQPSIVDLREMFERGDTVRAFIVTNGAGWAFRLFDLHNVSLVELNWLEFGLIKAIGGAFDIGRYLESLPKRMALALLQRDEVMVKFLVNEMQTVGVEVRRLQDIYGALPQDQVHELLSLAASITVVGETFLQKDKLQSDAIFERHMIEAFNAISRGDSKLALSEVLKFSLSSVSTLSGEQSGDSRLSRMAEISSRLRELRLPTKPQSARLEALARFLRKINACAYSFLAEGYRKLRDQRQKKNELEHTLVYSLTQGSGQARAIGEIQFSGAVEFMQEAIDNFPDRIVGQIRKTTSTSNRYAIDGLKVVPCDIAIKYFGTANMKHDLTEAHRPDSVAGKVASRVCVSDHEMLSYLHPRTSNLNDMLRSGYSLNALGVSNGKICILRLHDGSDKTAFVARIPP